MTAADLRLNRDQEKALRESDETGYWYPQDSADLKIAGYLARHGLFEGGVGTWGGSPRFRITAAGRDWLATHPTEVAR